MRTALILLPAWSIQNLPLGLATVASEFRHYGHSVDLFDINIRSWHLCRRCYGNGWRYGHPLYWDDQSRSSYWEETGSIQISQIHPDILRHINSAMELLLNNPYDLYAFSLFAGNIAATRYAVERIRKRFPDARILFGGPSAGDLFLNTGNTFTLGKSLLTENTCAIPGEAESTLGESLNWWEKMSGDPPPGLVYGNGSVTGYHPPLPGDNSWKEREVDFSGFNLSHYSQGVVPVEITRGCTRKCAYCSEKKLHDGFRVKSIDCLMKMFNKCLRMYRCRWFSFTRSNINGNFPVFIKLLERILKSGIRFGWGGSIILDKRLDTKTIRSMARAGCTYVNTGLESASPAVRDKMNKTIDAQCIERILHDFRSVRIEAAVNLITGFPGETESDHRMSLDFIRKNGKHITRIHVSPCRIFSSTPLFLNHKDFNVAFISGGTPDDWIADNGSNTFAVRRKRVEEIINAAEENGIQWLAPFEKDLSRRRNF